MTSEVKIVREIPIINFHQKSPRSINWLGLRTSIYDCVSWLAVNAGSTPKSPATENQIARVFPYFFIPAFI